MVSVKRMFSKRFTGTAVAMIVIMIGLSACNNDVFHNQTVHLKNSDWKATDTLYYNFVSEDTLELYDFYFEVRNTTDYDMQNLYLFITAFYPGDTYSVDTAECILAAPDGKWYGKGLGKHKDNRFLFRKGVRFRKAGKHTIAVNQAMRKENLHGISDIGIILKKQNN